MPTASATIALFANLGPGYPLRILGAVTDALLLRAASGRRESNPPDVLLPKQAALLEPASRYLLACRRQESNLRITGFFTPQLNHLSYIGKRLADTARPCANLTYFLQC